MIFMYLCLFRSTEMTETKTDGKMIKSKQQRSGADVNHSPMSPSDVWLSCGAGTLQWSHPATSNLKTARSCHDTGYYPDHPHHLAMNISAGPITSI